MVAEVTGEVLVITASAANLHLILKHHAAFMGHTVLALQKQIMKNDEDKKILHTLPPTWDLDGFLFFLFLYQVNHPILLPFLQRLLLFLRCPLRPEGSDGDRSFRHPGRSVYVC